MTDQADKGFATDQPEIAGRALDEASKTALPAEPDGATVVEPPADLSVLDIRPGPREPRDYHFPRFERFRLSNGLTVVHADLPGRALLSAQLLLPGGGWSEAADQAGVTVLTARAMPEGTAKRDADEFIEASERLGAEIHAEATWESISASVEVPKSRFGQALALLAEMVAEPAFPADEVDRLRDERLNDLMQAWADPRRRAERVFPETIYSAATPFSRPLGGTQSTVRRLDRDALSKRHAELLNASVATLIVAGDLAGLDLDRLAESTLGGLPASGEAAPAAGEARAADSAKGKLVLVDRPGAPQSEVRIGHIGVPRSTPDFHAISVLNAILGGTFNSLLNRVIREELGYTYSIHSTFDMRRRAGPFVIRTAVETAVSVPAILETLRIVREFRAQPVDGDDLNVARDYLVGVFPLRFESAAQVAAALGGLIVLGLPDDELDRYRPQIAGVSAGDVLRRGHEPHPPRRAEHRRGR